MAEPQIVTIFRSRLREPALGYDEEADRMEVAAAAMPGFIETKTFIADDGERVTLSTFATRAEHDAWRDDEAHAATKRRGRAEFYETYHLQVCEVVKERTFERGLRD